jgi:hypothetical protein
VLILLSSKEKKILDNFYKNKINFKLIDTYVDIKFKKNKISLLKNKIKDLGEFLLSICNDDNKKQDIKDALIDLPF